MGEPTTTAEAAHEVSIPLVATLAQEGYQRTISPAVRCPQPPLSRQPGSRRRQVRWSSKFDEFFPVSQDPQSHASLPMESHSALILVTQPAAPPLPPAGFSTVAKRVPAEGASWSSTTADKGPCKGSALDANTLLFRAVRLLATGPVSDGRLSDPHQPDSPIHARCANTLRSCGPLPSSASAVGHQWFRASRHTHSRCKNLLPQRLSFRALCSTRGVDASQCHWFQTARISRRSSLSVT